MTASPVTESRSSARRFRSGVRGLAFGNPFYAMTLGRARPRALAVVPPDPWPGDAAIGGEIASGVFRLAGDTLHASAPTWLPLGMSDDFIAALHGFDWLRDLRSLGGDGARRTARRLVASWLDKHDHWHELAWRADVAGRRIAAWIAAHDFFCASAEDDFRARVYASLARQIRHLGRAVPGDLTGEALIAAIKGLLYGAIALPHGDKRPEPILRLLARAIDRQVLSDGGHASRNAAAHLAVLRHLIDIRAILRSAAIEPPELADDVQQAIDRMAPALRALRHGDGGLASFNGAVSGRPLLIDTVLTQAGARIRALKHAPASGYERVMAGRTLVLMDVGAPPPPGLDRDAHAGPLSFELSVGRQRMIVNCGAWPAPSGRDGAVWHGALRSTAAHSTVTVADTNAIALAEGGGIVRRPGEVSSARQEIEGATLIEAAHDGYAATFGLSHRRLLYVSDAGDDIRGEDVLVPVAGDLSPRPYAVRFHLHPAAHASLVQGGDAVLIKLGQADGWRLIASGGEIALEDSIYVGDGMSRRRTQQIVISGHTDPKETVVKWAFHRERKA